MDVGAHKGPGAKGSRRRECGPVCGAHVGLTPLLMVPKEDLSTLGRMLDTGDKSTFLKMPHESSKAYPMARNSLWTATLHPSLKEERTLEAMVRAVGSSH